ncbi:TMS membrane protein/tumor differentially hypothetical protein [Coccomyxa subellipsoidea C-169]|uniref:Serinc-domain-containing protein n=1 Tax=Coccomyxa subellipsoidea (strain C-169) TaxID=574566 RepID=I0Z805_COCSC|nr:TMS membrane protein/tumor differentially hypothetical protein [Coccomyxa subellipsoidea C-169]EIE26774.1 TMS membrane protein/tumor differentially hypothetical protein [Coccomyxa subellipsoidea C-169]|eukprot:XP_005651318.1 TMS membrane protein/tumor differentially hypothetical protein [Coccomyxa subellipsoidea C-169]
MASRAAMRKSARLAYCILFTLAMVLAWILRDFAKPIIDKLPWIIHAMGHGEPSAKWYGQQAVYRVSMGNFIFFGLMSLAMVGVKYKSDKRDQYLQHGGWFLKVALWLLFNILPFFFPVSFVNGYGWVARVGSACFLCVQILMLLDFVTKWNDTWVDKEDERYLWALLTVTCVSYLGTFGLAGILFYFFTPVGADECSFNVSMITFTLIIGIIISGVSMSSLAKNGSLFPSAIFTFYCTYLCYSALVSEPHDYQCNGLGQRLNAASATTLATGMLLTLVSVVYSALRAGSNTALFRLNSEEDSDPVEQPLLDDDKGRAYIAEEGTSAGLDGEVGMSRTARTADEAERAKQTADEFTPVTYNYAFFHFIFAVASMYLAMLMTGWGTGAEERDLIDVGWFSVWVKFVTQWATAATYCWMLVAPTLFPDREFL